VVFRYRCSVGASGTLDPGDKRRDDIAQAC
jgi:hypothetical protein